MQTVCLPNGSIRQFFLKCILSIINLFTCSSLCRQDQFAILYFTLHILLLSSGHFSLEIVSHIVSSFQVLKESFHPQVAPRVREWLNEADGEGMGLNN